MRQIRRALILALLMVTILLTVAGVRAQDGYDLSWWTADGGGGRRSNAGYTVWGTAGQVDAAAWSDGEYTVVGGFWAGDKAAGPGYAIYLPLLVRH
jgi:hypothetical protein